MSSYSVGERYWIPDDEHAWLVGILKDFKNSVLEFNTDKGIRKFRVNDIKQKLDPCGNHLDDFVENLVDLDELSEGAILHHVRNRFAKKYIYTHVGSILVAVNPFENLPIYGDRDIRRALESTTSYPHVFVTAAIAYNQLRDNQKNQSVLISGESGAGKTETTKKVLQFLANVAPDSKVKDKGEPGMETKILQSNPLLEALGNAKTLRNNNSSRFGKWMKVGFDTSLRIQGCEIINYLLEKSRVVQQSHNERNYHIFYQLIAGADNSMKQRLKLKGVNDYHYLNLSGCTAIPGVDDSAEFKDVMQAMITLQFSSSTIENFLRIIAGILQLGNINFDPTGNGDIASVSNNAFETMHHCAELLGLDVDGFQYSLVEKKVQMGKGSIISIKLSPSQAVDSRDTLSKTLYSNLFDWIIDRVNFTLKTENGESPLSIGILDIFGFEVFDLNSFEQLCINYANEKLQFHFNEVIFNQETMMYQEEGVPLDKVQFEDNGDCVNLIEGKPYGLLSLLEEECSLGNATDLSYASKIEKAFNTNRPNANKYYIKNKTKPECFSVLHFAGPVEYNVTNFLDKNRDNLSITSREMMEMSQIPLVAELFHEKSADGAHASGTSSKKQHSKSTLGGQFRNQLIGLLANLRLTEPHFIRCVKPNHAKVGGIIDAPLALRQLKYAGLFEAIRIRKSGFAYRATFNTFANTYQILIDGLAKKRQLKQVTDRDACKTILSELTLKNAFSRDQWCVGEQSKVFLKNNADRLILDRERNARIMVYVLRIQKAGRDFNERMRNMKDLILLRKERLRLDEEKKKMKAAIILIQKHWRRKMVQNMMRSMMHLIELRKVLAKREVHKLRIILAKIDNDLQGSSLAMNNNMNANATASPGFSPHRGSTSSPTGMKKKLSTSMPAGNNQGTSYGGLAGAKEDLLLSMFERDIKVARVMLRLLDIQDQLLTDLQSALARANVSDLNRLLMKADRLEMHNHPLVLQGKEELIKLHNKRRVMKSLLQFLKNEDEYHEDIQEVIDEAKQLDIDKEFIHKVQMVFDNVGPRVKIRNRLRTAIELVNLQGIEQAVLDVVHIRDHHSQFAESELRAARMLMRLLHFDQCLEPNNPVSAGNTQTSSSEGESSTANKDILLWGEKPRCHDYTPNGLSYELIDLCDQITEATIPSIEKLHKLRLQEMAGSLDRMYQILRYYKWSKSLCTWKYPEIAGNNPRHNKSESFNLMNANHEMSTSLSGMSQLQINATTTRQGKNTGGGEHLGMEDEFYGMQFKETRCNAFIIRSLHQDFDLFAARAHSATMDAALSNVEITSSVKDTLKNLDLMKSIDKSIELPNGQTFQKSASKYAQVNNINTIIRTNSAGNMNNLSPNNTMNRNSIRSPGSNPASPLNMMMTKSARSYNGLAATSSLSAAFANFPTAPRDKVMRKAPLPNMPIKRVEELDDNDPEKQLYESRAQRTHEFGKVIRDLNVATRFAAGKSWR